MRSMPSASLTNATSSAKSPVLPAMLPRQALTFWPRSVTSFTPCAASAATSASTSANGRDTSSPRVYGTTQKLQYLLQPSMIVTKALAPAFLPASRGAGRLSNFSISGKLMSTCGSPPPPGGGRRTGRAAAGEQLGQPVQRLRPEHHVDERRTLDDRRAFLARDAAADRDHQAGIGALQMPHAPEVGEHLFLRLLAHRAGVEDDDIGVLGLLGALGAMRGAQHVGNLLRVVLVHLAAESAQVELAHQRAASSGVRIHTWPTAPVASRRYLTSVPVSSAAGTMTRFAWSRICAPGARRSGLPFSSMMFCSTWRISARSASSGMLRNCAIAVLATNAAMSAKALMRSMALEGKWWRIRDSNPGHTDYDSAALTS